MHTITISHIKSIEKLLKDIKGRQDTMRREAESWSDPKYDKQYLQDKVLDAEREFNNWASEFIPHMLDHCDAIRHAEEQNAMSIEPLNDPKLASALQIISSMGKALPHESQIAYRNYFKGNVQAEKMLQSAYLNYELPVEIVPTDYNNLCNNLRESIFGMNMDKSKTPASFRKIELAANAILEAVQSEHRVELGVKDDAFMQYMSNAAGLNVIEP